MEEPYAGLCQEILDMDKAIRIVGITNDAGGLLAGALRKSLSSPLNSNEMQRYIAAAIMGTHGRQMFEQKIGKLRYMPAIYDSIVTITIPVSFSRESRFYIFVSVDVAADYRALIEQKVLPFIATNKADFV